MFDKVFQRGVTLSGWTIPLDIMRIKKRANEENVDAYFTLTYFCKQHAFFDRRINKIENLHIFYSFCEDMDKIANVDRICWHIMIPPIDKANGRVNS